MRETDIRIQKDGLTGDRPVSPFLADESYTAATTNAAGLALGVDEEADADIESPFLMESADGRPLDGPEGALYQEVVGELFDDEFDEDVAELVGELSQVYDLRMAHEAPTVESRREAERQLARRLEPLREEAEAILQRMAAELGEVDLGALPEPELDRLLDGFVPTVELETPAMDHFLGGLIKKAKKAVKKVAKKAKRVASKVAKTVGKFAPHAILLRRLRGLVKPLLRQVLRFAINKLPSRLRPLARRLAQRFLKISAETPETLDDAGFLEETLAGGDVSMMDADAASPDTGVIQAELDALVATSIVDPESFDASPTVAGYLAESDAEDDDPIGALEEARDVFVREVTALDDGEDPTPQVEQFVAAILPALRLGIKLIGRKRVVGFLSGLVARRIKRFVGRQAARPLSTALVDAGLGLLSLETPEPETAVAGHEAAGAVLAATVEETMERLVDDAPDEAFDDDEILESYVEEAFEGAAASNFPAALMRRRLRAHAGRSGTWVPSPAGGVKRFKRYTRPIEVTITAAAAQRIRTFGGQTLAGYLSEQLGLPIAQTAVRARLHLFESMRGARLEHLALHANGVAGLGSARAASVAAFHPLTCTAAGLLIPKDVGLCRDVPDRFLTDRRRIAARQRFYVVEVPGARIGVVTDRRTDAGAQRARVRPQRPGSTAVTFDLRRHQVVVRQFLSERRAQEIAEALRRRATTSTIGALLRRDLPLELRAVLSGRPTPHLRLVREAPLDSETPRSIASALRLGGAPLVRSFVQSLGHRVLKRLAQTSGDFEQRFRDAAEHGADGVTVVMTMEAHRLFDVLRGSLTDIRRRLAAGRGGLFGDLTLDVRPGFRR